MRVLRGLFEEPTLASRRVVRPPPRLWVLPKEFHTAARGLFMKKEKAGNSEDLFPLTPFFNPNATVPSDAPLAVRMRPEKLDEILGQDHVLGEGGLLRRTIQSDRMTSIILYGPPGSGKTTLARVISKETQAHFVSLNAVDSNVSQLRAVISDARKWRNLKHHRTILFIDEIHRFNRAQQDVLMPDVEERNVILIGATTLNPSFVIQGPLLSRALVIELKPLAEADLEKLLDRALRDPEKGFGKVKIKMESEALSHIVRSVGGDARRALNALEVAVLTTPPAPDHVINLDRKSAEESCQRKIVYHDREGDYHYDIASAFIKSMRGSDPDAAIYWLAKMLYAGEDPRFVIRRILILASEDIGNADPQALILASAGLQAIEFVGMPEARIILAQLVTYMALAPKSNASYLAIDKAMADVKDQKVEEVPMHLRDASYRNAKKMGHGQGYQYAHNFPDHYVDQIYFPKESVYYTPSQSGYELELSERLKGLQAKKQGVSP